MQGVLGQIVMFAGDFAPRNWALCQGQLLPINQNQALFSLLGNRYGGDGKATFALPDLRGRAPTGVGEPPAARQQPSGSGARARLLEAVRRRPQPRDLSGVDVQFIICIQGEWPERW